MKVFWPLALLGGAIAWLFGKRESEPSAQAIKLTPKTESYRIWAMPLSIATGIPIEFALAWIQKESGGNPCAYGTATAKGPDGHPREQGLAQLYNPDDLKKFGVKPGELRVYCKPGTQSLTRALTPEEIARQMKLAYQLMGWHRSKADEAMRKNGVKWGGKDYWRAVKLDHALPGLMRQGMARVTASLGRPPRDWYEFKNALLSGKVKLDSGTERYRKSFARLLANAEKTGESAPADSPGGSV